MSENGNGPKKYPVSEYFVSPQGEGIYQGCMMFFLRLAGCTVGKPYPRMTADPLDVNKFLPRILPVYTEKCTLYDGRTFPCDTDYRVKERLTVQEILDKIPADVRRVCITGGEPCMHDLSPLLTGLFSAGKHIHLETSGTIMFDTAPVWVTVSPKHNCLPGMIDRADEIKLLVDKDFDAIHWLEWLETEKKLETWKDIAERKVVFLHPVNYENEVHSENMQMCMDWQKRYPQFRVGIQLHKAISMITKEHVR